MCLSVQRVHWLRARAQKKRWEEELILVKHEMEWTSRYFLHRARLWHERYEDRDVRKGPKAYAARQSAQWKQLAAEAEHIFRLVNRDYIPLIVT